MPRVSVTVTARPAAVQVPGARVWTGDSHAAQGDGVVDQTAIETAMEDLRIQYLLHKRIELPAPVAETPVLLSFVVIVVPLLLLTCCICVGLNA